MIERIVASLTERGCLLDPQAAAHIATQAEPEVYVDRALGRLHEIPLVLTLDALKDLEASMPTPAPTADLGAIDLRDVMPVPAPTLHAMTAIAPTLPAPSLTARRPLAADHASDVRVLRDSSGSRPTGGDVRDFVKYFNDRLETVTRLLRQRREVANAVRIRDADKTGRELQLIGLVKEKARRPSGHRFFTLEDATGEIEILVPGDPPTLAGAFDALMNDEVIGIVGRAAKDGGLVVAQNIVRPDIPFSAVRSPVEVPLHAAFLGDVHVGSKTFLEKPFRALVRWLKGDQGSERERAVAQSIKYLVFPGDLVDGVGVYPGQQEALAIEQVGEQYAALSRLLEEVPDYMHFVLMPGNHDASRPNEPQPALNKDLRSLFGHHETTFVSNPSTFAMHGVRTLVYHGYSMIDFATTVPGLKMDQPLPIMRQMLQCRHLAPTYGGKTPISPEERDFLVVDQVPDLFVTGHVHVAAMERYKSVTMVNGGTWQSQTDYQRMQNLLPTPARLPVVNLSTLNGSMVDFLGAD